MDQTALFDKKLFTSIGFVVAITLAVVFVSFGFSTHASATVIPMAGCPLGCAVGDSCSNGLCLPPPQSATPNSTTGCSSNSNCNQGSTCFSPGTPLSYCAVAASCSDNCGCGLGYACSPAGQCVSNPYASKASCSLTNGGSPAGGTNTGGTNPPVTWVQGCPIISLAANACSLDGGNTITACNLIRECDQFTGDVHCEVTLPSGPVTANVVSSAFNTNGSPAKNPDGSYVTQTMAQCTASNPAVSISPVIGSAVAGCKNGLVPASLCVNTSVYSPNGGTKVTLSQLSPGTGVSAANTATGGSNTGGNTAGSGTISAPSCPGGCASGSYCARGNVCLLNACSGGGSAPNWSSTNLPVSSATSCQTPINSQASSDACGALAQAQGAALGYSVSCQTQVVTYGPGTPPSYTPLCTVNGVPNQVASSLVGVTNFAYTGQPTPSSWCSFSATASSSQADVQCGGSLNTHYANGIWSCLPSTVGAACTSNPGCGGAYACVNGQCALPVTPGSGSNTGTAGAGTTLGVVTAQTGIAFSPIGSGWASSLSDPVGIPQLSLRLDLSSIVPSGSGQYVVETWCNSKSTSLADTDPDATTNSFYNGQPIVLPSTCSYTTPGSYTLRVVVGSPAITGSATQVQIPVTIGGAASTNQTAVTTVTTANTTDTSGSTSSAACVVPGSMSASAVQQILAEVAQLMAQVNLLLNKP